MTVVKQQFAEDKVIENKILNTLNVAITEYTKDLNLSKDETFL